MTESCCARLYVGKGNAGRVRQVETGLDAAGGDGTELRARHQLFQLKHRNNMQKDTSSHTIKTMHV